VHPAVVERGPVTLARQLAAEGLGTAALLAVVVGPGIIGERLAAGHVASAVLANSLVTGCILAVLIAIFGPLSGAHFNPEVTVARAASDTFAGSAPGDVGPFMLAQFAGALAATAAWRWLVPAPPA
jgi:glycerol uptake facilitator-like aquaporin